jgi:hypothetical protein
MGRIPMPPPGIDRHSTVCVKYAEDLYIDMNDNGFLAASVPGLFKPDLPYLPGQFCPKNFPLGPFKPQKPNTTVDLVFGDIDNHQSYVITLSIQDICP